MLNFDVKRKINTLRDILVGKVPDPKAQVEQITIALIYKFMDDMDLAGAEFGGKRVFFAGDYEKYAFTQIMLPEHSSQDRLNLYAEGIEKMVNNAELPQLFRDILRGAYIPYRDPETLNRFLKEIAEFNYDHSEDLGDSFEYLLSIMGSQGDAGQFRTPRHIIDMMVEIIAPRKNETVLDPACGTAGFLISAYKYIDKQNRDEEGKSTLSGEDRKRMADNFAGYDISPDMVRLSRVNMYLHGFSNPQINEYDTLTSLDKWDDTYDVILANPPFMTPKGGISPHNRYRVSAKRAEVLFVDYIAEHLTPTGRAAVVVPEGIVFQSQTSYKNLRRYLIEDNLLYGVISLPAGVFNPYSGVKTSILLIDKTLARERDSILFVKLNNDGYDLGAQRREISGNEIPTVVSTVIDYKKGVDVSTYSNVIIANKADIAMNDYVLVGDRYEIVTKTNATWPLVKIGDICCEIKSGFACGNSAKDIDGVLHVRPMNITSNGYFSLDGSKYISAADLPSDYQIKAGDILFNNTNSKELVGKTCYISENIDAGFSNHITRIRVGNQVLPQYLAYVLQNMFENGVFVQLCNKWVGQAAINIKTLASIAVPLPPMEVQESIVSEISSYQRVVSGAQQIIQNYKPSIQVDLTWDQYKLGEICDIKSGGTPSKDEPVFWEGGTIPWLGSSVCKDDVVSEVTDYITENGLTNSSAKMLKANSTLIALVGATIGKTAFLPFPAATNQNIAALYPLNPGFLTEKYLFFISMTLYDDFYKLGNGKFRMANLSFVRSLSIPVPPVEIQNVICSSLEEEICIVKNNKRLIDIFEKKIKDKMSEVWG